MLRITEKKMQCIYVKYAIWEQREQGSTNKLKDLDTLLSYPRADWENVVFADDTLGLVKK